MTRMLREIMERPEHRKKPYTVAEVARKAGISPTTLWRIEQGEHQPRETTKRMIAAVLKVKPEEIAEFSPTPRTIPD